MFSQGVGYVDEMLRLYFDHANSNTFGMIHGLRETKGKKHVLLRNDGFPSSVWHHADSEGLAVKAKLCELRAALTARPSPRAGRHTDDGKHLVMLVLDFGLLHQ